MMGSIRNGVLPEKFRSVIVFPIILIELFTSFGTLFSLMPEKIMTLILSTRSRFSVKSMIILYYSKKNSQFHESFREFNKIFLLSVVWVFTVKSMGLFLVQPMQFYKPSVMTFSLSFLYSQFHEFSGNHDHDFFRELPFFFNLEIIREISDISLSFFANISSK